MACFRLCLCSGVGCFKCCLLGSQAIGSHTTLFYMLVDLRLGCFTSRLLSPLAIALHLSRL